MEKVSTVEDINNIKDNKILFENLELKNTCITFHGKNNVLYCENNVTLKNAKLNFCGDNSLVYLSNSSRAYIFKIDIYKNCVMYFGSENSFNEAYNRPFNATLSEHQNIFIGDDNMFSFGIFLRNADAHLIYDCKSIRRINNSKSIYIGDHVWIGQDCYILKGTEIDSGSIVGASSVVSNKKIQHNSLWAGNPSRKIKEEVFWSRRCVHDWDDNITNNSEYYDTFLETYYPNEEIDEWIYELDNTCSISFKNIDNRLRELNNVDSKLDYLASIKKSKNRFVH